MNWRFGVAFLFAQITTLAVEEGEKMVHAKPGDIVKAIAPSCKASESYLPIINAYIESLGLVANMSENMFSNVDPIYANSDEFRANDLVSALLDDNIKVIWAVHGGTGCIRLIPLLEAKLPTTLRTNTDGKRFMYDQSTTSRVVDFDMCQNIGLMGEDDDEEMKKIYKYTHNQSSILTHVKVYYSACSTLGMMLDDIAMNFYPPSSETAMTTVDFIFGRQNKVCLPATKMNDIHVTKIESKVVGGNSAMVEMSIGTVWEINAKGRILFLEDIADNAEHIEKRLDHMLQSRTFEGVEAVIFGDFSEADNDDLIDFVLDRFARSVSFPVFRITNMGHDTINYPLPFLTHSVINSVAGGMIYEFCVENIK